MTSKNIKPSTSNKSFLDVTKYIYGNLSASDEKSFEAEMMEDENILEYTSDVLICALKLNMTEKDLIAKFEESEQRVYQSLFQ